MNSRTRFLSAAVTLMVLVSVKPALAAENPKPLPGVKASDLITNLENRRWKCTKPEQAKEALDLSTIAKGTSTFNCASKDKSATVVVWSTSSKNITWITVNSTTRISYGWPRFLATLPMDGVNPTAAQKWVTSALDAKASSHKVFGDIRFSVLIGSGIARTLTIAHKSTVQP
jgi:hypothetical protein